MFLLVVRLLLLLSSDLLRLMVRLGLMRFFLLVLWVGEDGVLKIVIG